MTSKIDVLTEEYGRFEKDVRRQMERWCGPFCASCESVCCRPHFCQESLDSVFLQGVIRRFSNESRFVPTNGWLGPSGCGLVAGRPPVCYEFVCESIFASFPGDRFRHYAVTALSMVMTHVGRRVFGSRHVVEAIRTDDLRRVAEDRFMLRLDEARFAFCAAVEILEGRFSKDYLQRLSRIVPRSFEHMKGK